MSIQHRELKVIGVGHMRTGTNSLKLALERLYGQKCYHMVDIIYKHNDHIEKWIKILDRGNMDKEVCDQLFQGYGCAVDYPVSLFYKDLMQIYPNAKFILTTRDSDSWVQSVKNTTMKINTYQSTFHGIYLWISGKKSFTELREKLFYRVFRVPVIDQLPSDEIMKHSFETFNEEVRKTVPEEKLLEFNVKEGWKTLCSFLDLSEPSESFPFVNTTKQFQDRWKTRVIRANVIFGFFVTILIAFGVFLLKKLFG